MMGPSPADNLEGYDTAVLWRSEMVAQMVKGLFAWRNFLESIGGKPLLFGPMAMAAAMQKSMLETFVINPAKVAARVLAGTGQGPDIFIEQNEWLEHTYARLLYEKCDFFIRNGVFDSDKALRVSTTIEGKDFLEKSTQEFALIEHRYNSRGLTRLKAMKELLKCLLMVITEKPLKDAELPFRRKNKNGTAASSFADYLGEIKTRLENLHRFNAFDIKTFSEKATQDSIGCSPYDIVEGSRLHAASLRFYPLPKKIQPNEKVLYLITPLVNKPEIFDLAPGKSVVEGMLKEGYTIYMADNGEPGAEESKLGLDFYGKTIHDKNLELIVDRHPGQEIHIMAYCMGGTLILPYLARRAEERRLRAEPMDVHKVVLMASPVKVDDTESGYAPVREIIQQGYDAGLMKELFEDVNVPVQVIEAGMNQTQYGVQYHVAKGFYDRAISPAAIEDSAPFFYWLTHGRMFPARAHREWIQKVFIENQIYEEKFCLPSTIAELDGKPVNMDSLREAGVTIFDYRGKRDMISPLGSCVASEIWGQTKDRHISDPPGGLNRTVEKNIGHIFVVSKKLLAQYLEIVSEFLSGEPQGKNESN
jgi:poly(3-hydroxyalkanoate) synthetase